MLSTIMTGESDFADVLSLVGVIIGLVASFAFAVDPPHRFASCLLSLAVALVSFGLLAL